MAPKIQISGCIALLSLLCSVTALPAQTSFLSSISTPSSVVSLATPTVTNSPVNKIQGPTTSQTLDNLDFNLGTTNSGDSWTTPYDPYTAFPTSFPTYTPIVPPVSSSSYDDSVYDDYETAYHTRLGVGIGLSVLFLILSLCIRIHYKRKREQRLLEIQGAIIAAPQNHGQYPLQPQSEIQTPGFAPVNGVAQTYYAPNAPVSVNHVPAAVPGVSPFPVHNSKEAQNTDVEKGLTSSQVQMVEIPLDDHEHPAQYPAPQPYQQLPPHAQQYNSSGQMETVHELPDHSHQNEGPTLPPPASKH